MAWLIDAYNVLHRAHHLPTDRAVPGATSLCRLIAQARCFAPAVVVADGRPKPDDDPDLELPGVTLLFSGPDREADAVIADRIARDSAPRRLTIVSSDRQIQKAGRRRRCNVLDSDAFCRALGRALTAGDPPAQAKPEAADVEKWMREFGYDVPSAEDEKPRQPPASDTEKWMREFGFDDIDGES